MDDEDKTFTLGIDSESGYPLREPTDADVAATSGPPQSEPSELSEALKRLSDTEEDSPRAFGVAPGDTKRDPNDLAHTGWGVLYGPTVSEDVKREIERLIQHRREQGATPLVVYDKDGVRPGESVFAWLKRRKVRLDQVEPDNGVPYYLLIVASPQDIPFEFQYSLDLYWACGRLWFDTAEEFARYVKSVIDYENPELKPETVREVAVFAPKHDFDDATNLFTRQVVEPLCGRASGKPLGRGLNYRLQELLGDNAKKDDLEALLRGQSARGTPALLFSGGHGMQFPNGDPLQLGAQGALVCQDWEGYGEINPDHWFAASDVPSDAKLHGMIHFMFACHGGGAPQYDDFDRLNRTPAQIAPQAFFSRLPQVFLAHKNGGALAVLAHMERAWAYSFQGDSGIPQNQGMLGVLRLLLQGERIGNATNDFNFNWATISTQLSSDQLALSQASDGAEKERLLRSVRKLWIQRDDARNFMVFGDPAVRLREKELQ